MVWLRRRLPITAVVALFVQLMSVVGVGAVMGFEPLAATASAESCPHHESSGGACRMKYCPMQHPADAADGQRHSALPDGECRLVCPEEGKALAFRFGVAGMLPIVRPVSLPDMVAVTPTPAPLPASDQITPVPSPPPRS